MLSVVLAMSLLSVDDPGVVNLSLPPQWAIAGQEWRIYWDDCITVDGAWTYDVAWSLTPTPASGPAATAAGLTWTPANAGDYVLDVELTSSGVHVANVSVALHISASSALSGSVSVFGDSLSGANPWQALLAAAEPGITWLGTVGVAAGLKYDSRGGWQYYHYLAGFSGSSMSPLICGPGAYCSDAGVPTVVVWACGTNDAANTAAASVGVVIARLDALMSEWRDQYPGVVHVVWTPPPGSDSDVAFDHDYHGTALADQYYYEQRQRALTTALIAYYANREAEGIYLAALATGVDTTNDYPVDNALHPTATGYQHIADAMRAALSGAGL